MIPSIFNFFVLLYSIFTHQNFFLQKSVKSEYCAQKLILVGYLSISELATCREKIRVSSERGRASLLMINEVCFFSLTMKNIEKINLKDIAFQKVTSL